MLLAPNSSDLAAAGYRSELFSRDGFTLWDNGWYGGHHLLAYSLLAPALGSLLGTQPLGALATVLAVVLFGALIDGRFSPRATRAATVWFALGASISLLANRIPFELGVAVGLASLLAAQRARGRRLPGVLALALAVLSALASPVAGAFVGLAALAWALERVTARAPSRSTSRWPQRWRWRRWRRSCCSRSRFPKAAHSRSSPRRSGRRSSWCSCSR